MIKGIEPEMMLFLPSLSMKVRVGQAGTLPFVASVENASEAERAGIAPGSEINELSLKHREGMISFRGRFRRADGSINEAAFNFSCIPESSPAMKQSKSVTGDILYLRFDRFSHDVFPWLENLVKTRPRGIILDLRGNTGGSSEVMQRSMGIFFPANTRLGSVISSRYSKDLNAIQAKTGFDGKVAVLIGPISASAAEVSANAFSYYGRAKIYGLDSLGEVLLSNSYALSDGGVMQIAVADFRGPDGKRLERRGVKVNYKMDQTLEAVRSGRDLVLDQAVFDLTRSMSRSIEVAREGAK